MEGRVTPDKTPASPDGLAEAHGVLLRDRGLQFERSDFTPREAPPPVDTGLGDALAGLAPILNAVFWVMLGLLVVGVVWLVAREVMRMRSPRARPKAPQTADTPVWRPAENEARDLLARADALARDGQYGEAAHLILLHSVEDIRRFRPRAINVSLTTREIGSLRELPESARPAFTEIGRIVEHSLFGGAAVSAEQFQRCRDAYAALALPVGAP